MDSQNWGDLVEDCNLSSEDEVPEVGSLTGLIGGLLSPKEVPTIVSNPPLARGTAGSAGYDLPSIKKYVITPGQTVLVDTGVRLTMPSNYYAKIYDRSSIAANGLTTTSSGIKIALNPLTVSAGVIDSDYDPDKTIQVLLTNHGTENFNIQPGQLIAQIVIHKYYTLTNELPFRKTTTHTGFGSTN